MLMQEIQGEQRVAQVVQHAHEQHEIKLFVQFSNAIDGKVSKLDLRSTHVRGKTCLGQVLLIGVDRNYTIRAALLHLNRVKARIAADIQYRFPAQIFRDSRCKPLPLDLRVVSEEMIRRSFYASQIEVVK